MSWILKKVFRVNGVKEILLARTRSIREFIWIKSLRMRLLTSIAWKNAIRSKYRSFLLILGLILTTALETGIVVSIDTLYDDFLLDHRNQNHTDITVNPTKWHNLTTLKTLASNIKQISGVSRASPMYHASLDQFNTVKYASTNILLCGIDSKTHPDFPYLNVIKGSHRVSDNTILISKGVQEILGVNVGEEKSLSIIDPDLSHISVKIGGIISNEPFFANKNGFLFILVDIRTLMDIIPKDQRPAFLTGEIDVSVANLVNVKEISENIKDKVGLGYFVFQEKDISEIEATGIRAYQSAMSLVIITSFFVEFLFITNILAIAIKDRQREIGILRAIGGDSKQLIELIALEILIYSIIGCTFGVFVGISFSTLLMGMMDEFYTSLEFQTISIHPSSIIATFMSGIIVALISGLYPIFLAVKIPVIQNIHSRMRTGKSFTLISNWRLTVGAGVLLILTGFSLQFFVGPARFLDFSLLSIHFFIVAIIFLGTVLLEIGLLVFLPRIGKKVLFWFGQETQTIAMRNIAREFQKSLFTIMTAAMALTFIIVVGLTSIAITSTVPNYFQNQWGNIELVAEVSDSKPQFTNLTHELDNRSDIKRSSFIQEARTEIEGISGYVLGVDPFKYSYFSDPVLDTLSEESSFTILNKSTNDVNALISHVLYQKFRPLIPLGSEVSIKLGDNRTVNITLSAVIKGNVFLNDGKYLYIASKHYQEFFNSTLAKWFLCDVEGDVEEVQASLEVTYDQFKEITGITFFKEALERSLIFQTAIFQVLFVESFILAAITQFICILVSTLRMEREMGIMRSVGLHRKQVFGIFMAESIALAFSALIFGLIDGLLGSSLLVWYISLSIPIDLQFPVDRIFIWLMISVVIIIASAILPSYRSSQRNLVATISGRPMSKAYVEKRKKPKYDPRLASISTSFWGLVKANKVKILIVFLLIVFIVYLNYFNDKSILLRGLVLSDYIWRGLFIQPFVRTTEDLIIYPPTDLFLHINPLLLFLGLAASGSIAFYLINDFSLKKSVNGLSKNILYAGIAGILICFILYTVQIVLVILLLGSIQLIIPAQSPNLPLPIFIFIFGIGILIVIAELLIFQRLWVFLIYQGVNPNISFNQKLNWTLNNASKGQIGFLLLNSAHLLIQTVLYVNLQPDTSPSPYMAPIFPLDLPIFLILAGFEISFLLILIIYQLLQFLKQYQFFPPVSTERSDETKSIQAS